ALRVDDVDLTRDRALVERYQAGDSAAFDELYRRYYHRLERFCLKRVGDSHEAEEVAQEAFVRALKAMPNLDGERRFYPWVSVIAARLCVDTHRRRGRTAPSADIDPGVVDGGQDLIVEAVDIDLLRQALGNLGPRHREVLNLREQEGWSYQRIAEHYDVSLGTVEALLFRARKALKREFLKVSQGDKGGFLAGVPLLGWRGRRLTAFRARVEAGAGPNLAPLATHVSMAVVVGSAAIFVTTHTGGSSSQVHDSPGAHAAPQAAPAANPPAVTSAVEAPSVAAAPSSHMASPTGTAAGTVATSPAAATPGRRPVAVGPATVDRSGESQTYAQQAPLAANTPHVVAGLDPTAVTDSAGATITTYSSTLKRGR
ncbi:MAG: polymerase sigma-70 factor, subfamily, partial [Acidimicrobiaceae bacterium]|nr:polymerase sigma-70 factor, subfamily [Acidimicrobiaceae bacterium]